MCYAIPGKVVGTRGRIAVLDYFGERREAVNELGAVSGEYAYAQGGFVVDKVPASQAVPVLEEWKGRFFQLKELDGKLSAIGERPEGEFGEVIGKALEGAALDRGEIIRLIEAEGMEMDALLKAANSLRARELKNSCCVHGIIEFSNYCRNACSYCGIRGPSGIRRYRMEPEEIVGTAERAVRELGFRALVLQSGEDYYYSGEILADIARRVRSLGALVFMSVGSRDKETYREMWDAGARGVLLRFETSDPGVYGKVHSGPKAQLEERLSLIRHCRKLGYIVATGSIAGLPGQGTGSLADDILLTRSLGAEMWSFGPFIPHPETPRGEHPKPELSTVLKLLATSRLVQPDAKILVTTALETLHPEGRRRGLLAGANSLMINLTPAQHRSKYSIYPGRPDNHKGVEESIAETLKLLYSLGRAPTDLGA